MKTERQVERRIEQLESKIERLSKIANAPQVTPGPFVTGRSGYTMGKQLDRENERRANAFRELQKARDDLRHWRGVLDGYRKGECHLDGRRRADAPSRKREENAMALWAEFMRSRLKKGDTVAIAGNLGNTLTVQRVNKKSITASSGTRWTYGEIWLCENGVAMDEKAAFALFKVWREERGRR